LQLSRCSPLPRRPSSLISHTLLNRVIIRLPAEDRAILRPPALHIPPKRLPSQAMPTSPLRDHLIHLRLTSQAARLRTLKSLALLKRHPDLDKSRRAPLNALKSQALHPRRHPPRLAIHLNPTRRAAATRKVAMKSPRRLRSHPNRAIHPSPTRRAAAARKVAMKSPRRLRSHPSRAIHPSPTRRAAAARKVAMKSPRSLRSHPSRAIHPSLTRRAAAAKKVAMKSLKRNPIHPSPTKRAADTRNLRQQKEALQRMLRIPSPIPNLLWLSKHNTLLTLLLNQATPPRTLNPLLTLQ